MSINNYNLSGGIKQYNPIETIRESDRMNVFKFNNIDLKKGKPLMDITEYDRRDKTEDKTKGRSKYIRMDNFMKPNLPNLTTVEEIKRKIKTKEITFVTTFNEEDDPKFIKVVTMAPGFVYGVDTRTYYPKKNVPVGPSISDMSD